MKIKILNIADDLIKIKILNNKKEFLSVFAIKWQNTDIFYLPNNLISISKILTFTKNEQLEKLNISLSKQWKKLQELKSLNDINGNQELRNYQRVDVNLLKKYKKFGLFNEMRTGKTPTILITLEELKIKKALFIVPKSTIFLTWVPEIKKWTNKLLLFINNESVSKRKKIYEEFTMNEEMYLVISRSTFRNDIQNELIKHNDFALIIDEAHYLRNYKTMQSIITNKVAGKLERIYCLTGTPANNHPSDIFGILQVINPEKFKNINYWDFVDYYFGIIKKRVSSRLTMQIPKDDIKKELEAEFIYLTESVSIMRKQKDLRKQMPEIIVNDVILDMSKVQENLYNKIIDETKKNIFYNEKSDESFLTLFNKLRLLTTTTINFNLEDIGVKFQWIIEFIKDNPYQPIIVYSTFSNKGINILNNILNNEKIINKTITGQTSAKERFEIVQEFQNNEYNVILCNIKATNVGITLDRARVSIFLNRELNPTENLQAENRFLSINPNDNELRQIINLYCANSIDLKIKELLNNKINITEIINKNGWDFFKNK